MDKDDKMNQLVYLIGFLTALKERLNPVILAGYTGKVNSESDFNENLVKIVKEALLKKNIKI